MLSKIGRKINFLPSICATADVNAFLWLTACVVRCRMGWVVAPVARVAGFLLDRSSLTHILLVVVNGVMGQDLASYILYASSLFSHGPERRRARRHGAMELQVPPHRTCHTQKEFWRSTLAQAQAVRRGRGVRLANFAIYLR